MGDCTERTPKVLIVDDEIEVAKALRRMLSRRGFEVEVAFGGLEGLALVDRFGPDVVISDYRMPGMNGPDFLAQVAARAPSAARFLISGQTDLCAEAQPAGASGHRVVAKPWDNDELIALLRRAVEERASG